VGTPAWRPRPADARDEPRLDQCLCRGHRRGARSRGGGRVAARDAAWSGSRGGQWDLRLWRPRLVRRNGKTRFEARRTARGESDVVFPGDTGLVSHRGSSNKSTRWVSENTREESDHGSEVFKAGRRLIMAGNLTAGPGENGDGGGIRLGRRWDGRPGRPAPIRFFAHPAWSGDLPQTRGRPVPWPWPAAQ
jgi:hypothetical protein